MPPNDDGQIDPREWLTEALRDAPTEPPPAAPRSTTPLSASDIAAVVRAELVHAVAAVRPIPAAPSPWTPRAVGALLTTLGTVITTILVGSSQIVGAGDRAAEQTRAEIRAAIDAHAQIAQARDDAITTQLVTVGARTDWAVDGVCAVNGAPLHPTQHPDCAGPPRVVQRDPVKVARPLP